MKVKFLKDHLDNKEGDVIEKEWDVIEVDEARANYFILVGIAKEEKKKTEKKQLSDNPGAKKSK